jgi:hypothetical protein
MMTSARPMAISKSRVHTRISWRKESNDGVCSEEVFGRVLGEIAAALFEFTLDAPGFSSECSILLPRIYNMSIAERARFPFRLHLAHQRPNPEVKVLGTLAALQERAHNFDAVPCIE